MRMFCTLFIVLAIVGCTSVRIEPVGQTRVEVLRKWGKPLAWEWNGVGGAAKDDWYQKYLTYRDKAAWWSYEIGDRLLVVEFENARVSRQFMSDDFHTYTLQSMSQAAQVPKEGSQPHGAE